MASREQSRPASILITDDNRDAVEALSTFLEVSGFGTLCAYSAAEALEALDAHPGIAWVVSDVRMPELNGFDFLRVVKHRFPKVKVVLVTGHEITHDDVVPAGATILRKPVDLERLLEIVSKRD
ncbi:MAG: response regulator [Burkholderiales bacterium]